MNDRRDACRTCGHAPDHHAVRSGLCGADGCQCEAYVSDVTSEVEQRALTLWRAKFGSEPREPLREKGGALDPEGWCMRTAIERSDITAEGDR